jgi:hypothetical protein
MMIVTTLAAATNLSPIALGNGVDDHTTTDPGGNEANNRFEAALTPEQVVPPEDTDGPAGVSNALGTATFTLSTDETKLLYDIRLSGVDLNNDLTDVTAVHVHVGAPGSNGPHVLNIFGLTAGMRLEDDADLTIDEENNSLRGTWDDSDVQGTEPLQPFETKPFTEFRDELLSGSLYVQVHTVDFSPPNGEIRGQIIPQTTTVPDPPNPLNCGAIDWFFLGFGTLAMVVPIGVVTGWTRRRSR